MQIVNNPVVPIIPEYIGLIIFPHKPIKANERSGIRSIQIVYEKFII